MGRVPKEIPTDTIEKWQLAEEAIKKKEYEDTTKTCRAIGINVTTFYHCRRKFGVKSIGNKSSGKKII